MECYNHRLSPWARQFACSPNPALSPHLSWLYSSEQYSVHSAENLLLFSKAFLRLVLFLWGKILHQLICFLAVVFVQASFDLHSLSTYPVLLLFLYCLLNPLGRFLVFFCSFCFTPLLLQILPLITDVENICDGSWLYGATSFPSIAYEYTCIYKCYIL